MSTQPTGPTRIDRLSESALDETAVVFEPMCSAGCPGSYLEATGGQHLPDCDQYGRLPH